MSSIPSSSSYTQCFNQPNCSTYFSATQCNTIQPNSIDVYLSGQLNNTVCTCTPIIISNASCSTTLSWFAHAPSYSPTNNTYCTTPAAVGTEAEVVSISIILGIFFGLPLIVYITAIVMKIYVTGKRAEQYDEQHQQQNPNPNQPPPPTTHPHHHSSSLRAIPPAIVTFHNITYQVSIPKSTNNKKKILNQCTGAIYPKSLTAIMGPSGCGKSSLLDVLAYRGRGRSSGVSGIIRVNGYPRGPYWKRMMGYVEQFDALFAHLTVREMLLYTAELRLSGTSRRHKEKQVISVLKDLELEHVAGSLIGDPLSQERGISGGQARRVTVGVELLSSPSVLLLDEPTTGLDSATSQHLVKTLQKLAVERGCCVACTIHQPRSSTFSLFDSLILMIEGRIVYCGKISSLRSHLTIDAGITPPEKANLADFIVDMTYNRIDLDAHGTDNNKLTQPTTTTTHDAENQQQPIYQPPSKSSVQRLADAWTGSALKRELDTFVIQVENNNHQMNPPIPPQLDSHYSTIGRFSQPIYFQVYVLLHRSFRNASRNKQYWKAICLQNGQYLFFGLLFLGIQTEAISQSTQEQSLQGNTITWQRNFLYQVQNTVLVLESVVIATAFTEKRVFKREHAAGSYSSIAYHLTWFLRLTVDAIWKGFFASILCYFFPGLTPSGSKFFFFAATLCVVSSLGSSLALLMASAVDDAEGAANIHNTIVGFMGTYAGFFLKSNLIPIFTLWAYYVSFEKYSLEALENNQWASCASDGMRTTELSLDPTLNQWTNLLVLMAYPIIFHMLAFVLTAIMVGSASSMTDIVSSSSNNSSDGEGQQQQQPLQQNITSTNTSQLPPTTTTTNEQVVLS
jgi:ABC-type multidrug transport system ATPase subunit